VTEPTSIPPLVPDHSDREAFRLGIEQFNSGHFFESHEIWEEIWLRSREPEKTFLQGIIQIAAAFHHLSRGNLRGAKSLLAAGLARIETFPDVHRGIDLAAMRNQARHWAAMLSADQDATGQPPPRITVVLGR
jgi:predicted metal-dependent hydrolase